MTLLRAVEERNCSLAALFMVENCLNILFFQTDGELLQKGIEGSGFLKYTTNNNVQISCMIKSSSQEAGEAKSSKGS